MPPPILLLTGWLLDRILGEPRRAHPLMGFGRAATALEARLNRPRLTTARRRLHGALAVVLLVAPVTVAVWAALRGAAQIVPHGDLLGAVILYLCLGGYSLRQHAEAVATPLAGGDLATARRAAGCLVSRDTETMNPDEVAAAATESVLENGHDAVFATLFWFLVAGAPGAVAHRLVNTLDAQWGYRTPRYRHFGWAAARLDDLLGYLPARLAAASYALVSGRPGPALRATVHNGRKWPGINPGVVMAAGAGGLGLRLGGPASYAGSTRHRPHLNPEGAPADAGAIRRAAALVERTALLWLVASVLCWTASLAMNGPWIQ